MGQDETGNRDSFPRVFLRLEVVFMDQDGTDGGMAKL